MPCSLLSVLYSQVSRLVDLEEAVDALEDEVADLKGQPRPARGSGAGAVKGE
jgi:hypothetical protein